jgi:hypothetical protein
MDTSIIYVMTPDLSPRFHKTRYFFIKLATGLLCDLSECLSALKLTQVEHPPRAESREVKVRFNNK